MRTSPVGQAINGFTCTVGGDRCNGLDVNHFYTRDAAYKDPWTGPTSAATFMGCGGSGTTAIYRVWRDVGTTRLYSVTGDPAGWGAEGQELLGCVWP